MILQIETRNNYVDLTQIKTSFLKGDNQALEEIYVKHGSFCVKKLRQRGCLHEDAEGFFIESVMVFREKVLNGQITQLTNLRFYLYSTCENKFLAAIKSTKSQQNKSNEIEALFYESVYLNQEEYAYDTELMEIAGKAFNSLSEKCKDIIYYFYVEKLKMEDIAELLGLSNAKVAKSTKSRCYKLLRDHAKTLYSNAK